MLNPSKKFFFDSMMTINAVQQKSQPQLIGPNYTSLPAYLSLETSFKKKS